MRNQPEQDSQIHTLGLLEQLRDDLRTYRTGFSGPKNGSVLQRLRRWAAFRHYWQRLHFSACLRGAGDGATYCRVSSAQLPPSFAACCSIKWTKNGLANQAQRSTAQ